MVIWRSVQPIWSVFAPTFLTVPEPVKVRLRLTSLKRSLVPLPAEAWITAVAPVLTWIVPEAQRRRLVLSEAPGTRVSVPSATVVKPV